MGPINDAIREMAKKHVEFVDRLLEDLPSGSILCVHEMEFQSSDRDVTSTDVRFISRLVSHVIEDTEHCKARIQKTQYGPK